MKLMMTEVAIATNADQELLGVPYHDYQVAKFEFSEGKGLISLKSQNSSARTEFVIKNPIEYNVTNIFPDSIVGEVYIINIADIFLNPKFLNISNHIIGGRLHDRDAHKFLNNISVSADFKLLYISSVTGGEISVISDKIEIFTL